MLESFRFLLIVTLLIPAGCAAVQTQFLDNKQDVAIQTAVSRAEFEMDCEDVTPVVISREVVQPALEGPFVNGINRAEFTIGVAGCGRRTTFIVICPEGGEGSFAAGPGRFHGWAR